MNKPDRIPKMVSLITKTFHSYKDPDGKITYVLNNEPNCNKTYGHCDIIGFEYKNGKKFNSIGVDCKQSVHDFETTQCGEHFTFDANFLCVPSELVGYTIRYVNSHNLHFVGVIEYCDSPIYGEAEAKLRGVKRSRYTSYLMSNCVMSHDYTSVHFPVDYEGLIDWDA